jgi:hypothetical protein
VSASSSKSLPARPVNVLNVTVYYSYGLRVGRGGQAHHGGNNQECEFIRHDPAPVRPG